MIQSFKIGQEVEFATKRNRLLGNRLEFNNPICMEHWRGGKLLGKHYTKNDITNEGVNTLFNVMFNSDTQIAQTSWYIGFVDNTSSSFSAFAAGDVMSSHAGWVEFTNYSQATRVAWGPITASSGVRSVTNTSAAVFNINGAGGTIHGIFIVSNSTKSGTTGKLWATAAFGADVPVSSGDQLNITYTTSA